MISVSNLVRSYGRHRGVDDVSFQLEPGKVTGILGPNGAGKSTTIRVLTTHMLPTAGTVTVFGHDVVDEALEVRRLLGYLPENAPLYNDMRVDDFLDMVGTLRGLEGKQLADGRQRVVVQCSLKDVLHRPIDQLSRGFRQRVGLAQALIHNPRFLVLDEPTSGLDPNQVIEMRELIREVGRHNTVLFSSHILSEVEALCDRILILDQGKLVADASPEELRASDAVRVAVRAPRDTVEKVLKEFGDYTILGETPDGAVEADVPDTGDTREKLVRHLVDRDCVPVSVGAGQHRLETVFARLTGGRR